MSNPYTAAATAAVAVSVAFLKLPGIVDKFATSMMESQRHLAQYSAQLMGAMVRLDYQKRVLDIQTAQATSGTGAMLGSTLGELKNETQWMREGIGNVANLAGVALVQVARMATVVIRYASVLGPLKIALDKAIEWFGINDPSDNSEIIRHLRAASQYTTPSEPKNRKPPRDDKRGAN
jgi:hypothetical protein